MSVTRKAARQAVTNANLEGDKLEDGGESDTGAGLAAVSVISRLQSTLERAMRSMADVSKILEDLQRDVQSVKASQTRMKSV